MKPIMFLVALFFVFVACAPKADIREKPVNVQVIKPEDKEKKEKKKEYESSHQSPKAEYIRQRAEDAFERLR